MHIYVCIYLSIYLSICLYIYIYIYIYMMLCFEAGWGAWASSACSRRLRTRTARESPSRPAPSRPPPHVGGGQGVEDRGEDRSDELAPRSSRAEPEIGFGVWG